MTENLRQFSGWVHNLDPFIWQIYGQFGVRWYGLAYVGGFAVSYFIVNLLVKNKKNVLPSELVIDFIFYGALGTMIGGRIGYALFYKPELFVQWRSKLPYWDLLAVHEGGMASHGGIIGIAIALAIFAYKLKKQNTNISFLHLWDLAVVSGGVGVFFGRLANFINGELYGRPVQSAVAWAVKFPREILDWPAQAGTPIKSLSALVTQWGVSDAQWNSWVMTSDQRMYDYLFKIIDAIQEGNESLRQGIEPLLLARHPSQLYAAFFEGIFLLVILLWLWRVPRKPGFLASSFLMLYAAGRIFDELFRMPDADIGFQWLGLTRGQWLSVAMFIVGLGSFIWVQKRNVPAIGGWWSRPDIS